MTEKLTEPSFLQTYIVPICLVKVESGVGTVKRIMGTAFLINSVGYFLTARHVIEQAYAAAKDTDLKVALSVKSEGGSGRENRATLLLNHWHAPSPYDVSLGYTGYASPTAITLDYLKIAEWQDVAMLGYPSAALGGEEDNMRINLRAMKGYIHRLTAPSDMKIGSHPEGMELSFNVSRGMSGGPVFIPTEKGLCAVGVGVSSFRGETIEAEVEEVQEEGVIYRESRRRIEEFGFAHDIRPLLDHVFCRNMTLQAISRLRSV